MSKNDAIREERREKEARFDEVARRWKAESAENTAVREALRNELFALGFALYDDKSDAFITTFVNFFQTKYDPQKGEASHYFSRAMSRRKHDNENKKPRESGLETDTEDGKSVENAALIKTEVEAWENGSSVEAGVGADDTLVSLLSLILTLPERLKGKANNPKKITYYRMFFTDGVVAAVHDIPTRSDLGRYARHERDLFRAFQIHFLDFFMQKRCRTIVDVADCEVKCYGELISGAPMEHPGHPLPNDVYREYLNSHEGYDITADASVSNQRKEYRQFLHAGLSILAGGCE